MKKRQKPRQQYQPTNAHGAASAFGQMIGEAFAEVVLRYIRQYLKNNYPDHVLLEPEEGARLITLEMFGGTSRQMDNVITLSGSRDPVALFESKWLKDARHHNDKGAWILQLKEVRKKYSTLRGAAAILAGYWTEGVGVMFKSEGGINTVLVATDDEVYATIQKPVTYFLQKRKLEPLILNAKEIRQSLPRAWDLANCLAELEESGELAKIAEGWLNFERSRDKQSILGRHLIESTIDELLSPLPDNPSVSKLEIALQISTGNTIYYEFGDVEDALEFISLYINNPKAIRDKITPKRNLDDSSTTDDSPISPSADSPL